jgi:hypothetical protein
LKYIMTALLLLSLTACAQSKWAAQSLKLTDAERKELADITPGTTYSQCTDSSWSYLSLRWVCDDDSSKRGPRAILPMSAARAEQKRREADANWCDPSEIWGMSDGWHQYHCVADAKGPAGRTGHVEENKEAEEYLAKQQAHTADLANALTTRVLTAAEMKEVLQQGSDIFVRPMQSFRQEDVDRQYLTALDIQRELRLTAQDSARKDKP